MKFTSVLTGFVLAASAVSGRMTHETNAMRMARGLPPLAPVRRDPSPVEMAKRTSPSGGGNDQCCKSTEDASNLSGPTTQLLNLLGINISDITGLVGLGCSPITVLGNSQCSGTTVQCNNNSFSGLVALGCIIITL